MDSICLHYAFEGPVHSCVTVLLKRALQHIVTGHTLTASAAAALALLLVRCEENSRARAMFSCTAA